MLHRLAFVSILLFWIVMNVLLWRCEFKGRNDLGSDVPVEMVWKKILTAPDDSALEVSAGEKRIGYCRWRANVGEELATGKTPTEDSQPEGMVERLSGYTIDVEGNSIEPESGRRMRFEAHAGFTAANRWKDFVVRVSVRPNSLEIQGSVASEDLRVSFEGAGEKWERRIRYSEITEQASQAGALGVPFVENLGLAGSPLLELKNVALGLRWTARKDWLEIGRSKVGVYRLQARLLDKYQAVVIVSRVGEILRVELPNGILLVNDALTTL